jgi:hypothetical protein
MCDPITATVLTIASTAVGANSQRSAARKQFRSNATQREQQSEELQAQASVKAGERIKEARAEQARLRVAGGEAGVTGLSFEAQLLDSAFQADQDIALIDQNLAFADRASETRFQSANNSVNNPSGFQTGLAIAGAGVNAYTTASRLAKS